MAEKKTATAAAKRKQTAVTQNVIVAVVVALLVGWGAGYVFGALMDSEDTASSEAEVSQAETLNSHKHGLYEVSAEEAPGVEVLAEPDALGGWNVTLVTTNFTFTPQDVNETDELGTGHAHIWVDGEKLGRVYSNNYHLAALGEGDHEITVTLNTNTHKDYAVNGEVVSDSIEVTEVAGEMDAHMSEDTDGHSHDEDDEEHTHSN